jgi:esterase/lipase superfamily enzyme
MAQIVYDLQYTGTRVLFSWPSRGGTLAYAYDQNSALGARERFIELIQLLEKEAGIKKVHVLAHSMGNLVVLDALYNQARSANPVRIGELIMAAPDVDQDHYRQAMKEITKIASGLTLYASSADKAMVASRKLASAPRAGDVSRNQPVLVEGVEAIDVTAIGNELFGLNHDVFAAQRSLLNDIKLIMSKGIRPPTERLIEIRRVPEGAAKPLYWRYVP